MGVVTARLVFLAFLGLTGTIIYNALYLQEHGPQAVSAAPPRVVGSEPQAPAPLDPAKLPPVSTDLPPLEPGQGGSQLVVRAVQRELAARGFDVGQVDGTPSDKTRAAISAYESGQDLPVTGIATDDLLRQILLGGSVEKSGPTGAVTAGAGTNAAPVGTVKAVQKILADLGYAPGPIDGALGTNTAGAISAFQHDRRISETGRLTPELLGELERVTGRDLTKTAARP